MKRQHWLVTSSREWLDGEAVVKVEYSDVPDGFAWRLVVNGEASLWESLYHGIVAHRGYAYVTQYFGDPDYDSDDCIPVDQPFRVTRLTAKP